MHLLVAAPSQVLPAFVHTQPVRSAEDEELPGQVPAQPDAAVLLLMAIGVSWNVPSTHAEHALLVDAVPGVEKYSPADGHTESHRVQPLLFEQEPSELYPDAHTPLVHVPVACAPAAAASSAAASSRTTAVAAPPPAPPAPPLPPPRRGGAARPTAAEAPLMTSPRAGGRGSRGAPAGGAGGGRRRASV